MSRRARRFRSPGGFGGFAVDKLSGLLSWFRADFGVSTTGSNVNSWTSRGLIPSSPGNTGSNRPTLATSATLNNQAVLRHVSASSQYLFDPSSALAQAMDGAQQITVYSVVDRGTTAGGTLWAACNSGSTTDIIGQRHSGGSSTEFVFRRDFSGSGSAPGGTQTDDALPSIYRYAWNGSVNNSWVNEVPSVVNISNVALPVCDQFYIGSQRYSGALGAYFDGDIAEIIILDHVATASENAQIVAYLKDRYALFMPGVLSNFNNWWRADSGITLNVSNVSAWASKIGSHSLNQGSAPAQPPFNSNSSGNLNSQPSVLSGVGNLDSTAAASTWNWLHDGTSDWTYLWVLRLTDSGSLQDYMFTSAANTTTNGIWIRRDTSNNVFCKVSNSSGVYHGDVTSTGGWFISTQQTWFAVRYTRGQTLDLLWSGGNKVSTPLVGAPNVGNAAQTLSWRGRTHYCPENLIWKSALSDAEITALATRYLNPRYGVAA